MGDVNFGGSTASFFSTGLVGGFTDSVSFFFVSGVIIGFSFLPLLVFVGMVAVAKLSPLSDSRDFFTLSFFRGTAGVGSGVDAAFRFLEPPSFSLFLPLVGIFLLKNPGR